MIQQIECYVLVPRIMDRSVGVHPLVTLLAIAAFGSLLGWAGAVLAIPLAAVIQVVIQRYVLSPEAIEPAPPEGRDAASLLRYQARELMQDIRLQIRKKPDATTGKNDRLEEAIEAIARDLDQGLADTAVAVPSAEGSAAAGRETAT
jgi:hypothetical protein